MSQQNARKLRHRQTFQKIEPSIARSWGYSFAPNPLLTRARGRAPNVLHLLYSDDILMALLKLPDEILDIIVEQIRTEAFDEHRTTHPLPCLNSLCALALTCRRFTRLTSDAIHREVRLVGGREQARHEPEDKRKARWRFWTRSCKKYPQLLKRVKVLRVMWFASFDKDLVDDMYFCVAQLTNLQHLALTGWTRQQQNSILRRIRSGSLVISNLKTLELGFNTNYPITPTALDSLCDLPSLQNLSLQFQSAVFGTGPSGFVLDEMYEIELGRQAPRLERIVLECKFLDHRILEFLVRKAPNLKQLTIPDTIGLHFHETHNWCLLPIPMRPTTLDRILQPLADTLESLTITTLRDYSSRVHPRDQCEQPVGFSNFSVLKSLDVPCHFLFDLSEDANPKTSHDLFPKSLKSLKLRFEHFFTIHETRRELGLNLDDWYGASKFDEMIDVGGAQQCQWLGLLLRGDKDAFETLRHVYARDSSFDLTDCHILAIDRRISGAFEGVHVSVRVRAPERRLWEQILRKDVPEQ